MTFLTTTLLASLVLQESPELAETAFRKVEARLETSKTFRFSFTNQEEHGGQITKGKGTVAIKEGRKVRILQELQGQARKFRFDVLSDGTSVVLPLGRVPNPRAATPGLRKAVVRSIVRMGLIDSWFPLRRATAAETPDEIEAALENLFQVSNLKWGEDDGKARTLVFRVRDRSMPAINASFTVTLSIDPKTYRILRRTNEKLGNRRDVRTTEVYGEMTLDADIPDKTFTLSRDE